MVASSLVALRHQLGVGAVPQLVALEHEVLHPQAGPTILDHVGGPRPEILDAAHIDVGRVDVDPVVGEASVLRHHQGHREEVPVAKVVRLQPGRLRAPGGRRCLGQGGERHRRDHVRAGDTCSSRPPTARPRDAPRRRRPRRGWSRPTNSSSTRRPCDDLLGATAPTSCRARTSGTRTPRSGWSPASHLSRLAPGQPFGRIGSHTAFHRGHFLDPLGPPVRRRSRRRGRPRASRCRS